MRDGMATDTRYICHLIVRLIDKFIYAPKNFAYSPQYDYFDHFNTIGWTLLGDGDHPKAMAVILISFPYNIYAPDIRN